MVPISKLRGIVTVCRLFPIVVVGATLAWGSRNSSNKIPT
jgi:hypothetical protein